MEPTQLTKLSCTSTPQPYDMELYDFIPTSGPSDRVLSSRSTTSVGLPLGPVGDSSRVHRTR